MAEAERSLAFVWLFSPKAGHETGEVPSLYPEERSILIFRMEGEDCK